MSKPKVIIQGISLYDIDLNEHLSSDDEQPDHLEQSPELLFFSEKEEKFRPDADPHTPKEATPSVQEGVQVNQGRRDSDELGRLKEEIDASQTTVHETWLTNENVDRNSRSKTRESSDRGETSKSSAGKPPINLDLMGQLQKMKTKISQKLQQRASSFSLAARNQTAAEPSPSKVVVVRKTAAATSTVVKVKEEKLDEDEPPTKVIKLSPATSRFVRVAGALSQEIKQEPEEIIPNDDEEAESPPKDATSLQIVLKNSKDVGNLIKPRLLPTQPPPPRPLPFRLPKTITISKVAKAVAPPKLPPGVEVFKCALCNINFASSQCYVHHARFVHQQVLPANAPLDAGIRRFRCVKCSASFPAMEELQTHLETHHERKFRCGVCRKTFSENGRLQDHLALHKDRNAFDCKLCSKKFTRSDLLNQHLKTFHSRKMKVFVCGICGYETMVKQNYEKHEGMHMRYVEKIQTNRFYHCDQCPQSFRDPSVLEAHKQAMHA